MMNAIFHLLQIDAAPQAALAIDAFLFSIISGQSAAIVALWRKSNKLEAKLEACLKARAKDREL